jgi:hypothetical protein
MKDKLYPNELFENDLKTIHNMDISVELKMKKCAALAYIFFNQNDKEIIEPFAITDYRENIIKKE